MVSIKLDSLNSGIKLLLNIFSYFLFFLKKAPETFIVITNFVIILMSLNILGADTLFFKQLHVPDGLHTKDDVMNIFYKLYFIYAIFLFIAERVFNINIKVSKKLVIGFIFVLNIVGFFIITITQGIEFTFLFFMLWIAMIVSMVIWLLIDRLEKGVLNKISQ
ncbi:MAG: hypothetical protein H6772_02615 [Pseudomonadales bacterium]|nr:hypothetical protein [Pseudomonadales bacterium]